MNAKPIVVLGAGGPARETMWLMEAINAHHQTYRLPGYLDGDTSKHVRMLCDRPPYVTDKHQLLTISCQASTTSLHPSSLTGAVGSMMSLGTI